MMNFVLNVSDDEFKKKSLIFDILIYYLTVGFTSAPICMSHILLMQVRTQTKNSYGIFLKKKN
jgi:hypothetical protein